MFSALSSGVSSTLCLSRSLVTLNLLDMAVGLISHARKAGEAGAGVEAQTSSNNSLAPDGIEVWLKPALVDTSLCKPSYYSRS